MKSPVTVSLMILILLATAQVFAGPVQQTPSPEEIADKKKEALKTLKAQAELKEKLAQKDTTSRMTALQSTVKGLFWRNPEWVMMLNLSADQQKKMDDIFLQYRLKLIDLSASLEKEELILEPLWGPARPAPENEAKILAQIDRIADMRAELEKANSRMLLSVLGILTSEQWSKLPIQQKKGPVKNTLR